MHSALHSVVPNLRLPRVFTLADSLIPLFFCEACPQNQLYMQ